MSRTHRLAVLVETEVGRLLVTFDAVGRAFAEFFDLLPAARQRFAPSKDSTLTRIGRAIASEIAGKPSLSKKIATPLGTPFQMACWRAARRIPRGETRTYQWLAKEVGSPQASRAAGQAMRRNPLPIIVPCHRVVSSSGSGGFSGSADVKSAAVRLKHTLLNRESMRA
ncbi:MAG: methylated-DNA--[protein]-cysteine S-methyltransferase [Planctomycetota bacterium]|nr:methylated-DNA--[protein]-cysteine S-methyltransferase [Planctomycetota bacterium]